MTSMPEGIPAISIERLRRLLSDIDGTVLLVPNEAGNLSLLAWHAGVGSPGAEQQLDYVGYLDLLQHRIVLREGAGVREVTADERVDAVPLNPHAPRWPDCIGHPPRVSDEMPSAEGLLELV